MRELEVVDLLGIDKKGNEWESFSNDPQIYLRGSFKKGWYKIKCEGSSESLRFLKLYIDYGAGFSEDNSYIIGKLDRQNSSGRPFEFKHDVVSLRLDPGDSPGVFYIQRIAIEKLGVLSILNQAFHSYRELNSGNESNLFVKVFEKWRQNGFRWIWSRAITLMANRNDHQVGRFEPYTYKEGTKITNAQYPVRHLFSIIIPVYKLNQAYLEFCLRSLTSQSYSEFEIIIISREKIVKNQFMSGLDLSKVQFIHTANSLLLDMVREASKIAQGDYITVLEQEDFLSINTFHHLALNSINSEDLIFTNEDRFLDNGDHFAPFYKEEHLTSEKLDFKVAGSFIVAQCTLFKEKILLDVKDYESFMKELVTSAMKVKHISEFSYHRRSTASAWPENQNKKTNIVSFYLPQFHAIPENDEWWGEGFTEWRNVRKATHLFKEHYQPHVPSDLGYYNLVEDSDIQKRQIELAKKYDIFGFCYYYYWFDGKRLLEKPMNALLDKKDLDFPFCICWANESWTRRWDGQEKEMLMKQVHDEDSDSRFIEEVIPVLKDERYIRIDGKDPILLIYRAELFPNLKATVHTWKEKCKEEGIPNLHVCMVQSFGQVDPTVYGCDSAVEFPPHGVYANEISKTMDELVPDFSGNIYDYREVVDRSLQKKKAGDFTWFRGTMLSWDNTARRKSAANVFHYANPVEYEKWLVGLVDYTRRFSKDTQQMIFVNAWNEWAEGTHLEPDQKYGHQYLEVTKRASRIR